MGFPFVTQYLVYHCFLVRLINPYYKPESVKPFSAGKPPPEASKLPPEDSSAPTSPPAARKYGRRHKAPVKPVPESADYPKPSETSADLMPKPTEPGVFIFIW